MLAFSRMEFIERPEVQEYENALENVSEMDDWARTQYYWSNNLKVAGIYVIGTPTYFGFNSVVATNYMIGLSITYNYYLYGPRGMLAFPAMIFMHGLLEITGVYIIAAVSLRVAWNLWKGMGGLMTIAGKEKSRWSLKMTKREKREFQKHGGAIKLLLSDFITISVIGALFVFLAAPIEAYISPRVGGYVFFPEPALAVAFLAIVGLVYAYIAAKGFKAMRRDMKQVWKETKLAFRGKWRPTQLSFLIFMIFFAMILFIIIF